MVKLDQLREYMRKQANEDKQKRSVQITGATIEEALKQASIELGLPVKKIEYEILEKGSSGTLGFGKKEYILIAYEKIEEGELQALDDDLDMDFGTLEDDLETAKNGEVFVRLTPDGALMKVTPPAGKGRRASEKIAIETLRSRGVHDYDERIVSKVVKAAEGEFIKVGDFVYNPANDPVMSVDISDFDMKAELTIQSPGPGGADPSKNAILQFLKSNGVVFGIKEESISGLEENPRYNQSVLVAEGKKAVNGQDARIMYLFETDRSNIQLKEKNGRVDFKEMNLVQNVVENQTLAKKIPADEGEPGRTVTGKLLPAKPGKDTEIAIGKNVKLSEDGKLAKATINGQVLISSGKINVEPIYVVNGNVNLKSGGNVIFLGTVLVKGSVDDGFKVKAAGNIEVMGNVGKAELDAEGDIIVHQGITAKGGGSVKAGRGVWAKFIENAHIDSDDMVVASDGIINSTVTANKRIVCQGKRATIVGGDLHAAEEIYAKSLGSVSGSETILEVGFDPKSKEKLAALENELADANKQLDEINLNIQTLAGFKKQKKKLSDEKEAYLRELLGKRQELLDAQEKQNDEIEKLKEYLGSLKIKGRIAASTKVYPGVVVTIKDQSLKVRREYGAVTFINEGSKIKEKKYQELEEDYTKRK